jgi:ABC-2 type transport system ATP-binding protein
MTTYTPPSSGSCTVLGVPYADLRNPVRHVGVLLDRNTANSATRRGTRLCRCG